MIHRPALLDYEGETVKVIFDWPIVFVAVCCGLVAPALAGDQVPRNEIRQNLFSTCFRGGEEAWIVGELGRVYLTSDSGKTFLRAETGTKQALTSVACLPDKSVVVVGPRGLAMRTRDGGKSWATSSTGTDRNLLSVSFADAQVGVAVGDFGTMIRTEDGGASWTALPFPADVPLPEDIAMIIEPGDVLLYDVDFPTAQQGAIVGEFGVILATTDAGRTWTAQRSPIETTLFGVAFADTQNGWAVGIEETLLHTKDGGATWERQPLPARKGFVLGLYDVAVQGRIGWVVGDSGLLLRTIDGGEKWERVDLPIQLAANWFRGISLTPDADGFVVGGEGTMLITNGEEYRELDERS